MFALGLGFAGLMRVTVGGAHAIPPVVREDYVNYGVLGGRALNFLSSDGLVEAA